MYPMNWIGIQVPQPEQTRNNMYSWQSVKRIANYGPIKSLDIEFPFDNDVPQPIVQS